MVQLDLLDKVEAFSEMTDEQLIRIQEHCEIFTFNKNDKLFTEGDEATHLWAVVEGDVELRFELPNSETSRRTKLDSVSVSKEGVAKTLGWSCFVPPHKMRLSAYCISRRCQIVKIPRNSLMRLFEEDFKMGFLFMSYIVKVVGFRFHQFQDEVAKRKGENLMSGW